MDYVLDKMDRRQALGLLSAGAGAAVTVLGTRAGTTVELCIST